MGTTIGTGYTVSLPAKTMLFSMIYLYSFYPKFCNAIGSFKNTFLFYFFWKVFVMKLWLCRTISHALDSLVTGYLFSESTKCLSMMIADNTTWKNMTFIRNYILISYNFVLCSLWNSFAIQNLPEYIFLTPFHCQQIRPSAQFSSKNRLLNVVKLFLKHQNILVF